MPASALRDPSAPAKTHESSDGVTDSDQHRWESGRSNGAGTTQPTGTTGSSGSHHGSSTPPQTGSSSSGEQEARSRVLLSSIPSSADLAALRALVARAGFHHEQVRVKGPVFGDGPTKEVMVECYGPAVAQAFIAAFNRRAMLDGVLSASLARQEPGQADARSSDSDSDSRKTDSGSQKPADQSESPADAAGDDAAGGVAVGRDEKSSKNSAGDSASMETDSNSDSAASREHASSKSSAPHSTAGTHRSVDSSNQSPVLAVAEDAMGNIWSSSDDDSVNKLLLTTPPPPLFVRSFPSEVRTEDFVRLIEESGFKISADCIRCVHLPVNRARGGARGYGFVQCATGEVALAFRKRFHSNVQLGTRKLKVTVARITTEVVMREHMTDVDFPAGYRPVVASDLD